MSGKQDYEITLPDGRSVVVAASSPEEASSAVRNFQMREAGTKAGKEGGVDNFGRSLARGATFGLADEFAAAADATVAPAVDWVLGKFGLGKTNTSTAPSWSQRYDENLSRERGQDKAYDAAYPGWSATGQIGGTLATLPMLPKWMLAGGAGIPGLARSAATGAGLGAVAGFGEGEGGFENRVGEAGKTAAIGGAVGLAAPVVGKVVGTAANAAAESGPGRYVADKYVGPGMRYVADKLDDLAPKLPPMMGGKQVQVKNLSAAAPDDGAMVPAYNWMDSAAERLRAAAPSSANILDDAAIRRIGDAIVRGGDTVETAGTRLTGIGTDAMPIDINPMTQRLGTTAYVTPGGAAKVMDTALDARNRGAPGRMLGALGDEANVPSIYDAERFLTANQRNVGSTAYGAMDAAGLKQSPELMKLYENPIVSETIDRIMRAEQQTRLGTNRPPASPIEIMHKVKQAIWDLGFDGPNARPGPNASWYRDLGTQYVDALKRANPELAAADRAYAEAASLPDWLKRGQNFMRSGTSDVATDVSPSALAAELPNATPGQGLSFKVGSTNTVKDIVAQGPDATRRLAKQVDQNELLRSKLSEIYGPDVAERMIKRAKTELDFARLNQKVRGGSDTVVKGMGVADEALSGGIPTSGPGLVSRLLSGAGEAYQKARAGNESVRERIAQMLTETDPALHGDLLARIEKNLAMAKRTRPGQSVVATSTARTME